MPQIDGPAALSTSPSSQSLHVSDEGDSSSSVKYHDGWRTRGAAKAKKLAEVLVVVEESIPKQFLSSSWVNFRQIWLFKTKTAKKIKEVSQALLDLEDGVRILNDRRSILHAPEKHAAWRKALCSIHTYKKLTRVVKLFKQEAERIITLTTLGNPSARGFHLDDIDSSLRHEPYINSQTWPVTVEVPPTRSECPAKEIVFKNVYKSDPSWLSLAPPSSSMQLSFPEIVIERSSWLSLAIGTP